MTSTSESRERLSKRKPKPKTADKPVPEAIDFSEFAAAAEGLFVPTVENEGQVTAQSWIGMPEEFHSVLHAKGLPCGHISHIAGESDTGKCHSKDTPILMVDGSIKMVQDVEVGDEVMGPDSKPRKVLSLGRGNEKMYDVVPNYGEKFGCNESHILSLKANFTRAQFEKGEIYNISIKEFLSLPEAYKRGLKLWRVGVEFPAQTVEFDPYFIGLWLGDGSVDCSNITKSYKERTDRGEPNHLLNFLRTLVVGDQKRIPRNYLINSRENRLALLAGLLGTDGYQDGSGFEITTKYDGLSDDILYLVRSLGFRATHRKKIGRISSIDFEGVYNRICISGGCDAVTGFQLEDVGEGDYYGFTLEGDSLYLLGDFTVTHNTTFAVQSIIQTQIASGFVLYGLTEIKFDLERAIDMGMDRNRVVFYKPESLEKYFEYGKAAIIKFRKKHPTTPILWVWDSISATPSEYELDDKSVNHNMKAANAISGELRRIRSFLDKNQVHLMMINRVYQKQTLTKFEKQTATYGGKAPKGFASLQLEFSQIRKLIVKRKVDGKDVSMRVGVVSKIENTKNHLSKPFQATEIGIDKMGFVLDGRKVIV